MAALMRLLKLASAPVPASRPGSADTSSDMEAEGGASTQAEMEGAASASAARHAATLPLLAALAVESSSSSSADISPGTAHEAHQDTLRELEERREALRVEVAKRRAAVDGVARRLWQLHAQTTTLLASTPSSPSS